MTWDPDTYLAFAGPRQRPALDLVERIPLGPEEVREVVDLGAGTGNLVPLLRDRFPHAHITAVDNDPEMLARAHDELEGPGVAVVEGDAATWEATTAVDVLFSNAALHWVDDHEALFPRLLGQVRSGGALAVQMPRNHDAPSHRTLAAVAADGPWADRLAPALRQHPVAAPEHYHRLLAPVAAQVDVWATEYVQHLTPREDGRHPVAVWMEGSTLRPLLARFDDPGEEVRFLDAFEAAIVDAYPPEPDGSAYFPFRRVFLVARAR